MTSGRTAAGAVLLAIAVLLAGCGAKGEPERPVAVAPL